MSPDSRTSDTAAGKAGPGSLRIFLNYRREDAADAAGRLFDALAAHFGNGHVFMDIDTIEPGVDFKEVVDQAVGVCDVLIAVIGRQWLTVTDARGRRRLDNAEDYVRLELRAALERDIRVIPVLVQGVDMPASDELPRELKSLARRNAVEVSTTRWRYDIGRLAAALERIEASVPEQPGRAETAEPTTAHLGPVDEAHAAHAQVHQRAAALEPANTEHGGLGSQPPASPPARSRSHLPLILLGIVVLLGIAAGALAGFGAFSHSGSTVTITTTKGGGRGGQASTSGGPGNGTTSLPHPGGLTQACGSPGITKTYAVSCDLANNVFYEYYKSTQSGGNGTTFSAWSSDTKRYYDVSCSTIGAIVKCAISGTTDPNAEVELTEAALSAYSPQQASSYAANHAVGPSG